MWILSWNIQKIDAAKARAGAKMLGDVVNGVVGDDPFVLIILENKTGSDEVVGAVVSGLKASDVVTKVAQTGGASSLRENIIIIAGNGATFDAPSQFTLWHVPYDLKCQLLHLAERTAESDRVARLSALRPGRSATRAAREDQVYNASVNTYRKAATLRNPIQITVRHNNWSAKILALHAPGPSDGEDHTMRTAEIFAMAVFATAAGMDMVIGDFNLRSGESAFAGFVDRSMLLGATTKGREDGRHEWSRLDRVYVRAGFPISSMLASDSDDRDLTDHHCLAIRIDSRPQRLITDYFQHVSSPLRRQMIGRFGRRLAVNTRVLKGGINVAESREKRLRQIQEDRRQRRLDDMLLRRKGDGYDADNED